MSDYRKKNKIEKINVGGLIFTTTTQTLSLLSFNWLDGSTTPMKDQDGNVFIDRDGEMFGYILNFCRNQKLVLPEGFSKIELLENEAAYYGLHTLVDEIKKEKQRKGRTQSDVYQYIEVVEERYGVIGDTPSIYTWLTGSTFALPYYILDGARLRVDKEPYTMLQFMGFHNRIYITKALSKAGWVLESSDMSSSCMPHEAYGATLMHQVQTYRDRWKKNTI